MHLKSWSDFPFPINTFIQGRDGCAEGKVQERTTKPSHMLHVHNCLKPSAGATLSATSLHARLREYQDMLRAPRHLGCDLRSLWHGEWPASQMRSPLSGPGSVTRKVHIVPDGVFLSRQENMCSSFARKNRLGTSCFDCTWLPPLISPNVCGTGK